MSLYRSEKGMQHLPPMHIIWCCRLPTLGGRPDYVPYELIDTQACLLSLDRSLGSEEINPLLFLWRIGQVLSKGGSL